MQKLIHSMNLKEKVGIGTVQFGTNYGISNVAGKTSENQVNEILEFAKRNSIRYIDTAYAYGDAEEVLGKNDIDFFKVISKYIPITNVDMVSQFNKSLNRLKISQFYGYLAHRPLSLIENNNLNWKKLIELKQKGLIKKIGASFNEVEEIQKIINAEINLDIIQVPYNFLDRRFENMMKKLKSNGCEIHTRSTFLQGLFFCDPNNLTSFFDEVKPVLRSIQREKDFAIKLLKFVLNKEFIDVVNIGVNNITQLRENIDSLDNIEGTLTELDISVSKPILMPTGWPK